MNEKKIYQGRGCKMKKLFTLVLSTLLILIFVTNVSAESNGHITTHDQVQIVSGTNNERPENDYVRELSYEEAVKRAAELSGKSEYEIMNEFSDTYDAGIQSTCSWLETSTTLNVTSSYKPSLINILRACRSGSFGWIDTNTKPMYIGIRADEKNFSEDIEVRLEHNGFYYVVNGNFYDHGTTTHQGTTGANAIWTTTYTISYASDHYASYYSGLSWRQVTR